MHWYNQSKNVKNGLADLIVAAIAFAAFAAFAAMPVARLSADEQPVRRDWPREPFQSRPANLAAQAKSDLESAFAQVQRMLSEIPAETAESWRGYLSVDEFPKILKASEDEQIEALERCRRRLCIDAPGIEQPAILGLRDAIKKYLTELRFEQVDVRAEYDRRMAELLEDLERYQTAQDHTTSERIGQTLGWLEEAGQARALVDSVRRQWSHPNLVLQVHRQYIAQFLPKEVRDQSVQAANILGTLVRGPTTTKGRLSIEFRDNAACAEVLLRMVGETQALENVGYHGAVKILSRSATAINANKRLTLDPVAGLVTDPADSRCNTFAQIDNICIERDQGAKMRDPLIVKIARNKSSKLHYAAEQEASRIASERINVQLDEQCSEALAVAQQGFHQYLRIGPLRLDEPLVLSSQTTTESLQLRLRQTRPRQLGAPSLPPAIASDTSAAVLMHESFGNNVSSRYLLGATEFGDEDCEHLAQFLAGEVPPELRVYSNSPPWSLELQADHPATVLFRDGRIDLTVHVDGWSIDSKRFQRPFDVRAVYQIEASRFGILFTRVNELRITTRDGRAWTTDEEVELLPHMQRKAAALLPASGRFNNLVLPRGGSFGALANLRLTHLSCDYGWLVMGYQDQPMP